MFPPFPCTYTGTRRGILVQECHDVLGPAEQHTVNSSNPQEYHGHWFSSFLWIEFWGIQNLPFYTKDKIFTNRMATSFLVSVEWGWFEPLSFSVFTLPQSFVGNMT